MVRISTYETNSLPIVTVTDKGVGQQLEHWASISGSKAPGVSTVSALPLYQAFLHSPRARSHWSVAPFHGPSNGSQAPTTDPSENGCSSKSFHRPNAPGTMAIDTTSTIGSTVI